MQTTTPNLRCKNLEMPMSALGQKRTWRGEFAMSALPPKADIDGRSPDVRFVPIADIPLIPADVRPAFHRKLGNGADT
jgi:hypothetical protein